MQWLQRLIRTGRWWIACFPRRALKTSQRYITAPRSPRSPTTFLYGKDGSEIATTRIWVSMHCGTTLFTQSAAAARTGGFYARKNRRFIRDSPSLSLFLSHSLTHSRRCSASRDDRAIVWNRGSLLKWPFSFPDTRSSTVSTFSLSPPLLVSLLTMERRVQIAVLRLFWKFFLLLLLFFFFFFKSQHKTVAEFPEQE